MCFIWVIAWKYSIAFPSCKQFTVRAEMEGFEDFSKYSFLEWLLPQRESQRNQRPWPFERNFRGQVKKRFVETS